MDPLELDETRRFTVDPRARVLVAVADGAVRTAFIDALTRGGLAAEGLEDPAGLIAAVERFRPDLVAIGESFLSVTGRQLALSLRARGSSFGLPIVGVLGDPSVTALVRWLSVGAVDVWPASGGPDLARRAEALVDECRVSRVATLPVTPRLSAYARRVALCGALTVYADTPFEGRAVFRDGALEECFFGEARGLAALAQLLDLDEAPMTWSAATAATPSRASAASLGHASRVLVVEDVELLARMHHDTLSAAGYEAEVARDGRAGLQAALARHFDVVLVDLNLPVLDGWGLMRQLREDPVARECSILVLSAQDAQVETLKAARAGARAWLKKNGRPKELLAAVELLVRPRALAWAALASAREATIELRAVGPVWLLRTLAELDCVGHLYVDDELAHFEVQVSRGQLASVTAQVGSRRVHGLVALQTLLGSRGTATFEPRETTLPLSAPWVDDAVRSACEAVSLEARRALERAIKSPQELLVNQELALLFARVATAREIRVMDAFAREPRPVEELALEVKQPTEEVRAALVELLRRGVLFTEP